MNTTTTNSPAYAPKSELEPGKTKRQTTPELLFADSDNDDDLNFYTRPVRKEDEIGIDKNKKRLFHDLPSADSDNDDDLNLFVRPRPHQSPVAMGGEDLERERVKRLLLEEVQAMTSEADHQYAETAPAPVNPSPDMKADNKDDSLGSKGLCSNESPGEKAVRDVIRLRCSTIFVLGPKSWSQDDDLKVPRRGRFHTFKVKLARAVNGETGCLLYFDVDKPGTRGIHIRKGGWIKKGVVNNRISGWLMEGKIVMVDVYWYRKAYWGKMDCFAWYGSGSARVYDEDMLIESSADEHSTCEDMDTDGETSG